MSHVNNVREIAKEIEKCYCYEFANEEEYCKMMEYLEYKAKVYIKETQENHVMRMLEIQENQKKILEEKERKRLLIEADKEYKRKFGRKPPVKKNQVKAQP